MNCRFITLLNFFAITFVISFLLGIVKNGLPRVLSLLNQAYCLQSEKSYKEMKSEFDIQIRR